MPQDKLLKYLEALKPPLPKKKKFVRTSRDKCKDSSGTSCARGNSKSELVAFHKPLVDIGLDCAVIPLKHKGLVLVQTTDFFYPLVDDPYIQGRIACCNVLSDMYAMGVESCDNMLMILGIPRKMAEEERDVVIPMMMKGFKDQAELAGTQVTGGQTVLNPWCIIGGTATAVVDSDCIIMPYDAQPGDLLVLTKPLGTQVAVNAKQWLMDRNEKWLNKIASATDGANSEGEINRLYRDAKLCMVELNKTAAKLCKEFNAHCATDVTGFGLLGHAENLSEAQTQKVQFVIKSLPILKGARQLDQALQSMFQLEAGRSAETSGGLLIALPATSASGFMEEFKRVMGRPCWLIGVVQKREEDVANDKRKTVSNAPIAVIEKDATIVDVSFDDLFAEGSNYIPGAVSNETSMLNTSSVSNGKDASGDS